MISNINVDDWKDAGQKADVTFDTDIFSMFTTFEGRTGCDIYLGNRKLKSGLYRYHIRFTLNRELTRYITDSNNISDYKHMPKTLMVGYFDYKKGWPYVGNEFSGGLEELKKSFKKIDKKSSKIFKELLGEIFK